MVFRYLDVVIPRELLDVLKNIIMNLWLQCVKIATAIEAVLKIWISLII